MMKKFSFNKILNWSLSLVVKYPASKSISYFWNGGSMLGMILSFQIFTGIFLVFFYCPNILLSFDSIDFLSREVNWGFIFRSIHLNLGSLFFLFLYFHLFRNLMYNSSHIEKTWLSGVTILILVMMTAFLGYVLPWGQMSFWGATVITNLISTIPIFGPDIVIWVWGGYNVNNATLSFFFTLHFLVPFMIIMLVLFHLIFLHETSSTSTILIHESFSKIKFFPYFIFKDLMNFIIILMFFYLTLIFPWNLGDPENWIYANPMMSPEHIQPEWYFLFAYAILRAIPSKLGGVIALVMSVFIFYIFPFMQNYKSKSKMFFNFLMGLFFWIFLILTWLGACVVEEPYIILSQIFSMMYFMILMLFLILTMNFDLKSNKMKMTSIKKNWILNKKNLLSITEKPDSNTKIFSPSSFKNLNNNPTKIKIKQMMSEMKVTNKIMFICFYITFYIKNKYTLYTKKHMLTFYLQNKYTYYIKWKILLFEIKNSFLKI